jgi:phage-related protein
MNDVSTEIKSSGIQLLFTNDIYRITSCFLSEIILSIMVRGVYCTCVLPDDEFLSILQEYLYSPTEEKTQTIKDMPGKVVEKTTGFVDKGINIANQVKDTAQATVQTGVNSVTNVTNSVTQGAQGATSNPLGAISNIGSNIVNSTVQMGQDL